MKTTIEVKVKLVVDMNEGLTVDKLIQELDYNFTTKDTSVAGLAEIEDTEIIDYDVTDARTINN